MQKRKNSLFAILLMLSSSLIVGCDKREAEPTHSQGSNNPVSEAKPPEPKDDYKSVDPAVLSFELKGYYSRSVVGEGGIPKTVGGQVEELICEGKKIELVSNKFAEGFLETKEYGKIKIQFSTSLTSSGFSVWLTEKQKEALIKAFK